MKFVIVLACLLALAYANEDAKVLKNVAEVNHDSYQYAVELDNTVKLEQQGQLKDKDLWVVQGSYEYVAPKGEHIKVVYTADDHGYQPKVLQ